MKFDSLGIIDPILRALEKEKYLVPTPIQEKTIPLLLDNKDVIGIAQTGTGKTAAFAIPILQKLHELKSHGNGRTPKALILAPTRELAAQISESFRVYATFLNLKNLAVFGGVSLVPQISSLQRGTDIIIATPGRLLDLMNQRRVNLEKIQYLVLDEADRMLDMGFLNDVKKIISSLPRERQSLFFSATMSKEITELTKRFLNNPVRVEITPESTTVKKIKQQVFFVDQDNKNELLLDLIQQENMKCVLVFVAQKHKANRVSLMLNSNGIPSDSIHGNKSQAQRMHALKDFKSGKIRILVATDIAARGIDVDNISHVINYDLPNEPENYVHRIGRTARAGSTGVAYSFCAAEDRNYLYEIEEKTKSKTDKADHRLHSTIAMNATGSDARPKPRQQRGGGSRRGGRFRPMRDDSNGRRDRSRRDNRGGGRRDSDRNGGRRDSGRGGGSLRGRSQGNRRRR